MNERALLIRSDWREDLLKLWQRIPVDWKKAFIAAMLINIIVYFFDLAQFPLGDHDVGYEDGIPLLSGGRTGRWFTPFLHLLSGHVQIPVYTQLLAFATQIAAGMGAVLLWRPKAGAWLLFAGGIMVSCMPAVTDFYYYHYMALAFTASQLFMVLALHASLKPGRHRLLSYALAVVLTTCALASYQSSIMTWTTCFWGLVLIKLLEWDGRLSALYVLCKALCPALLCLMAACLLYAVSLRLYPLVGFSLDLYQFQTVVFTDLPQRLWELVRQSWLHLVVPQGFMSLWLKILLLCALAGGAAAMLSRAVHVTQRQILKVSILIVAIALFPVAAKSQFLVSNNSNWYLYRFLAMGLSYVYSFFLLTLLADSKTPIRNVGLLLFILLLPCMAVNCLDQQIRHVRSTEHDMAVLNRVIGRIESLPNFDPDKTYNLVQLGRTKSYLQDTPRVGPLTPLSSRTISQAWNPGFELWLLSKYLKLGDRLNEEIQKRPDLMEKALHFARDKQAFPHQGSIGIVDDTIILIFDRDAIPTAEARLKTLKQ